MSGPKARGRMMLFCGFVLVALGGCQASQGRPNSSRNPAPASRQTLPNGGAASSKLTADLSRLAELWGPSPSEALAFADSHHLEVIGDQVHVTIQVQTPESVEAVTRVLAANGGRAGANAGTLVDAWTPVNRLLSLAEVDAIVQIRPPQPTRQTTP